MTIADEGSLWLLDLFSIASESVTVGVATSRANRGLLRSENVITNKREVITKRIEVFIKLHARFGRKTFDQISKGVGIRVIASHLKKICQSQNQCRIFICFWKFRFFREHRRL